MRSLPPASVASAASDRLTYIRPHVARPALTGSLPIHAHAPMRPRKPPAVQQTTERSSYRALLRGARPRLTIAAGGATRARGCSTRCCRMKNVLPVVLSRTKKSCRGTRLQRGLAFSRSAPRRAQWHPFEQSQRSKPAPGARPVTHQPRALRLHRRRNRRAFGSRISGLTAAGRILAVIHSLSSPLADSERWRGENSRLSSTRGCP
jgi:hypothetical protein